MGLVAVCLLSVPAAHGQRTGRVTGLVVDETGGIIPGASVTLASDDRVHTAISDQYGRFDFPDLPESPTALEVSSPGCRTVTMTKLQTGERGLFEITLEPGGCPQCVTVGACRPIVPFVPFRMLPPKVSYEERFFNVTVVGTVRDAWDGPLGQAIITLTKSGTGPFYNATTNDRGEFQFGDIEPGRYMLKATREGYFGLTAFWVARENLTRIDRVYLLSKDQKERCGYTEFEELESSPLPILPH
jgi:hypothetical protein